MACLRKKPEYKWHYLLSEKTSWLIMFAGGWTIRILFPGWRWGWSGKGSTINMATAGPLTLPVAPCPCRRSRPLTNPPPSPGPGLPFRSHQGPPWRFPQHADLGRQQARHGKPPQGLQGKDRSHLYRPAFNVGANLTMALSFCWIIGYPSKRWKYHPPQKPEICLTPHEC